MFMLTKFTKKNDQPCVAVVNHTYNTYMNTQLGLY